MTPMPGTPAEVRPDTATGSPVDLLPHRPPFRFVDRVSRLEPGVHVTAHMLVRADEPVLAGHFPGRPILPGVVVIEALAQAGAIALLADPRYAGTLPMLGGIDHARFRRQIVPGDEVVLAVDVIQLSARSGRARSVARVAGERAAAADLLFVIANPAEREPTIDPRPAMTR